MILSAIGWLLLSQTKKQPPQPRMIYDVEFAPSDQWMAVSDSSDNIWIYDLQGKLLRTLHHKTGSHFVDIEISPDGKYLVATNQSFTGDYCPVWSTATWKEVSKIGVWATKNFCDPPASIEFAGGGKYLVGPTLYSHEMFCWNTETGAIEYMARKAKNAYFQFGIQANSSLAILNEARTPRLRFWDFANTGKLKEWGPYIVGIDPPTSRQMKFSHDGKQLFIVTKPLKAGCIFNVLQPKNGITKIVVQDPIQRFDPRDSAWAGDDSVIWVGGLNGQIVCFDPKSGMLKRHWTGHDNGPIHALAATHKGRTIVTTALDTMCVWDGDSGKLLRTFKLP